MQNRRNYHNIIIFLGLMYSPVTPSQMCTLTVRLGASIETGK